MSDTYTLESSSDRKLKFVILGVIVAAFAIGAVWLTRPAKGAKPVPAVQDATAVTPAGGAMTSSAPPPACAADATASDATAGAAAATPAAAAVPAPAPAEPAAHTASDAAPAAPAPAVSGRNDATDVASGAPSAAPQPAVDAQPAPTQQPADNGAVTATAAEPASTAPSADATSPAPPPGNGPFKVEYVGQASRPDALAFRFSQRVADADDAVDHIHIMNEAGQPVPGVWIAGSNSDLLLYRNVAPGQYQVQIDPALQSTSGRRLEVAWNGSVSVP